MTEPEAENPPHADAEALQQELEHLERKVEQLRLEAHARHEAEEQARREREEAEKMLEEAMEAKMNRQAEVEQSAQEQERKAVVRAFLKENGYCNVDAPK